jgi:hypothetical protein
MFWVHDVAVLDKGESLHNDGGNRGEVRVNPRWVAGLKEWIVMAVQDPDARLTLFTVRRIKT